MATFSDLSPEQALQILALLSAHDLIAFSTTCKRYYDLGRDEELWLPLCLNPIRTHLDPQSYVDATALDASWLRSHKSRLFLGVDGNDLVFLGGDECDLVFHRLYTRLVGPHEWLLGWWITAGMNTDRHHWEEPHYGSVWRVAFQINFEGARNNAMSILLIGRGLDVQPDTHPDVPVQQMPWHPRVFDHGDSLGILTGGDLLVVSDVRPLRLSFDGWLLGVFGAHFLAPRFEFNVDGTQRAITGASTLGAGMKRDRHWRPWGTSDDFSLGRTEYCGADGTTLKRAPQSYNNAPFPSPSLFSVIRELSIDHETGRPKMTKLVLSMESKPRPRFHSLIPIISPMHHKEPSLQQQHIRHIVEPGVYTASYGAHGFEYLNVSFRELTQEDFDEPRWSWEGSLAPYSHRHPHSISESSSFEYSSHRNHGNRPDAEPDWSDPSNHLGPFSQVFNHDQSLRVSQDPEHLRVGARVMEVTKMTGDENVPQGQISIRAFLDDPLVDQTNFTTHVISRSRDTIPNKRYRTNHFPWPLVAHLDPLIQMTDEELFEAPFSPRFGVDLPATGRIAERGFSSPSWTDCVVHIEESREEFTVWWVALKAVSIFRKLSALPV
ncbi:hypothetical protein FRB96_009576 [Tulasnella sp. 330]|nr:hypothetical protein FRB96_009576 [Tulasnella sp. 330]KAG8872481.1 hypothetical protein FRB97_007578 [Tulasnella sp. 331]